MSRIGLDRMAQLAWPLSMLLVLGSLLRYTSWSNRRVFGRWSEAHVLLILAAIVVLFWLLVRTWRAGRLADAASPRARVVPFAAAAAAVFWSVGLFLDSLADRRAGGRLAELTLFGSGHPAAMLIEWLALPCVLLAVGWAAADAVGRRPARDETRRRRWHAGLLAIGSMAAFLVLLEGATRAVNVIHPVTRGFPTKSNALWERRFVQLNSLGYRDPEPHVIPAPGTRRIVLVGDSFAFGMGITDPRDRLGERLADSLNRLSSSARFEVMNAARPDTHTLHHIEALRRLAGYRPDYVLLIYVFNDIEHVTGPPRSVVTNPQGRLDRLHPLRLLLANSHLAEYLFVSLRGIAYRYRADAEGTRVAPPFADASTIEPHLEALAGFFALGQELGASARLIPFNIRVQRSAAERAQYEAFVTMLRARRIEVWSLADAFRGHEYRDLTVNSLDPHPNPRAHALAANAILGQFRASFLAKPGS
ncbi:MAG TPA: SGNH/GDSL hydrolase family protein [Candidatus Limnocylindrales bacterium]|nr:SGNH/GDSL hydrolase family protein [Candidatus Limnocylindrales bacterium]